MRFSIQEQNEKKDVLSFSRSSQQSYRTTFDNHQNEFSKEEEIRLIIASPITNSLKSGKKIQSKILEIEGEDFFSLEEIQAKFGLSPTKFLNQVKNDQFAEKD